MSAQVSIPYTHNLRGDLDLLPRLYTFIREHRRGDLVGRPYNEKFLLLDLGDSCSPDVWHCEVTGGRSTLLVLDAMGYHAANANHLAPEDRDKLTANLMQMALVDAAHDWEYEDILVVCRGVQLNAPTKLRVVLTPADLTYLEGNRLYLSALEKGQLGVVQVVLDEAVTLTHQTIHTLPPDTLPDPTISAAVEFVLSEARYFKDRG
jgi:hypothetical protein